MYNSVQNPDGSPSLAAGLVSTAAEQPRWYALQTRPRHEKKVAAELKEKGVEIYLPLIAQVRRWSDRRKIVQMPLFPCYAFVHTSSLAHARCAAFYHWGVLGFVSANDQALTIPDSEIEGIRALLASKVALTPYPFLKAGQRVRVRGGSLDGIEGILQANGDKRLVISVAAIHQSLSINIEGYDVEPI
jgi:transcription antitermination factor NusG